MFDVQKTIAGISISPERIFVTCLKYFDGSYVVERSVTEELTPGLVQNGFINNQKEFSGKLREIFRVNDIKARRVIACMHGSNAVTRVVSITEMPSDKKREALKAEIGKYTVTVGEAVIDYFDLGNDKVFLVGIDKKIASGLVVAIDKAGLDLVGIDIPPLAVLRALTRGNIDLSSKKATSLILVGENSADISVIGNGKLLYSRSIATGGIPELIKEIENTTAYWEGEFPALPIEKVVIAGDTSKAKNLMVEFPEGSWFVEEAKPLGVVPSSTGLSCSTSIGLAMRGMNEKAVYDINLLPDEKVKKMKLEKLFLQVFMTLSSVLFAFFIINFVFSWRIDSFEKNVKVMEQKLTASAFVLTESKKLNKDRVQVNNRIRRAEKILGSTNVLPWNDIMTHIRERISDEVWLTEIFSKDDSMTLRGKALSQDAVYEYVRLLGVSEYFYDTELSYIGRTEEDGNDIFRFRITCNFAETDE